MDRMGELKENESKHMKSVPLPSAVRLISPRLTALINTLDSKGVVNSAPYSWVAPVSFSPPLVSVGVGGKRKHTYVNAKATGEFVVNIVSEDFGEQAVDCAEHHKPGENLLERHGLHTAPSAKVRTPRVRESRAVLECRLKEIVEIEDSDHVLLIGEVVAAESAGGLEKIKPLMHDTGESFRGVGKEIIIDR
jgi:flavin reductase (DIM6/NTAB) family NADH-FMN oxidoreductase RutF